MRGEKSRLTKPTGLRTSVTLRGKTQNRCSQNMKHVWEGEPFTVKGRVVCAAPFLLQVGHWGQSDDSALR